MSLRLRLTLMLGSAFVLLWLLAAAWMLHDLRTQMMRSLDERLAASAHMVAGLLAQLPQPLSPDGTRRSISAEQLGIANGLVCQVSSLRGEVLARSPSAPGQALQAEDGGFQQQMIEGVAWRSFTLAQGELRITTADRLDERDALSHSVLLAAALPVAVALLGSLGLLWLCLGRGLAPLRQIRQALQQRSPDSLQPLQLDALPTELQPLVHTQNQLFQRIAQAIERERRFTGDAAHELRSPLTAIKTHLQVARLIHGESDSSLANAEAGADRLQRTLEQLLLLARVEGRQAFDDGLHCSAREIAHLAMVDLDAAQRPRIDLHLAAGLTDAPVTVPVTLLVSALRNLLENALRHTPAGSPVQLSISASIDGLHLSVRDHGPGIPDEHLPCMTRRFWRSAGSQGSGLGLSIVQAIAERCGGRLQWINHADGLEVTLWVP
ncbi:ATP-binding protein [Pseudomonas ovata]|uniref:ATP-binding protein n=1 Tax=Pseudomonas ovata TaxID=1839709 RepID=UPI000D69607B|nr:ATP-binding protein [Pseudomonas ovata]